MNEECLICTSPLNGGSDWVVLGDPYGSRTVRTSEALNCQ